MRVAWGPMSQWGMKRQKKKKLNKHFNINGEKKSLYIFVCHGTFEKKHCTVPFSFIIFVLSRIMQLWGQLATSGETTMMCRTVGILFSTLLTTMVKMMETLVLTQALVDGMTLMRYLPSSLTSCNCSDIVHMHYTSFHNFSAGLLVLVVWPAYVIK